MSTTSVPPGLSVPEARAVRLYRALLVLYPRAFRDRFGDEMGQTFADLLVHRAGGRPARVWPRVVLDLAVSAGSERAGQLRGPGSGRALGLAAMAAPVAVVATGAGGSSMLVPFLLLIALPAFGAVQLLAARLVRRTTGALAIERIVTGTAAFVPGGVWLARAGDGRGYWVVAVLLLSLVCGFGLAAAWAVTTLAVGLRRPNDGRSRRRAVAVLAAAVVVLGGMAAAGFNSYRNSQPPSGDHSDEHASAESRALWDGAQAGDLVTVVAMIDACADPFVHFNGLGRARSAAEEQAASWGRRDYWRSLGAEGEAKLADFNEIAVRLRAAENTWVTRCRPSATG